MKIFRVARGVLVSSLPLAAVMVIVCVFIAPMDSAADYIKLLCGYLCVIVGQSLFLLGLDMSILPIGKLVGESLVRLKKVLLVIFFGFAFGLFATVAEPALSVLARQTNMIMDVVSERVFIWVMSAGVGVFIALALLRLIKDISIKATFAVLYIGVFAVAVFVPQEFIALAFDGSGATTGDVSVPFMLALGVGVSSILSKHKTNKDAFGIIGIASVGPVLALFIYGIVLKIKCGGQLPAAGVYDPGDAMSLVQTVVSNLGGVAFALLPVVLMFVVCRLFMFKLPKRELLHILIGTIPVYVGLLIFLSGIDYGFAYAGEYIGRVFLDPSRPGWFKWLLLAVGFILGASITLSEPGVTVLGEQLEEITNGHIRKNTIRLTLAVGIGAASLLSVVKILTQVNILWFLVPLYACALVMMKFTPTLFVSLAFDSGGVSGGALTSAFLTPLTLGIAQSVSTQSVLTNGFGIIAFISVTPLIAVQLLGIMYNISQNKARRTAAAAEEAELDAFLQEAEAAGDIDNTELEK